MERDELKKACKNYKNLKNVGALATYGITPSTDLTVVKKAWEKLPEKYLKPFASCYGSYISNNRKLILEKNWKYYVAYPSMPIWFPKMVEEFNEFYDNLNIEILENKTTNLEFDFKKVRDYYDRTYSNKIIVKYNDKFGQKKVCVPLIRFDYADDYSPETKYIFNYSLVILIRMLGRAEKFTDPFYSPRGSKMRYLTRINNENRGYRSFSETYITLGGLKKFDDIELVNKAIEECKVATRYMKQTGIYRAIIGEKKKVTKKKKTLGKITNRTFIGNCQCDDCRRLREGG